MRRLIRIIFSNPLTYFLILFLIILIVVAAQPPSEKPETPTPQSQILLFTPTPTIEPDPDFPTPYPPEMLARSAEQTNGIVLMGILLVLIVVWGTVSVINQRNNKKS